MAVCSKGRISIHQTSSGIKLGEYDHAAGNESYLEELQNPIPKSDEWASGSKMNVICMETTMTETAVTKSIEHSQLKSIRGELLVNTVARNYNTSTGPDIRILPSQGNIRGTWGIQVRVTVGVSDILAVPLGPSGVTYRSVFLKGSTRILFITGRYLQLWDMSTAAVTGSCKLELIWALQAVDEVKYESSDCCLRTIHSVEADDQGKSFKLLLDPPKWFRGSSTLPKDPLLSAVETITFPMSKLDNLSISEQDRIELGVRGSVEMYVGGDKNCRKAVIQYLENIVRSSPTSPTCCVTVLCRLWKPEEKVYFEEILSGLLPLTRVTWVPNADIKDRSDPLSILFKKADSEPAVIGTAKVIMNYCVNHAKSLKNLALLSPIFTSMREVMTLFPEEAFRCLGRIAFIPVKQRSYIINNHTIAHPPKLRLQFWKPVSQPLHKSRDPIMQLDISLKRNPLDAKFANPIFMASFDALWSFHGSTLSKGDSIPVTTVWWHALFYMIKLKLRLRPETYVECYDFNLEYFDNPSIAALISYKW
ncbi:hypothetical protein BGX27_007624 [Mortierella sp. AM989]|nr:hypothetical protein BGX27_007624 [Mortierella sp. AM989]